MVPKYGFTIVRRNKLRRRLRELARLHLLTRGVSCDVLIRARREAFDASFAQLRDDVRQLVAGLA